MGAPCPVLYGIEMLFMWVDAIACTFLGLRPRWTAVVVDRWDGAEHPIESVRFRWRRNVERWRATQFHAQLPPSAGTPTVEIRAMKRGG